MEKNIEENENNQIKIEEIESNINKGATEPFKVTKDGIDYLIQKYLNRKFTEDLDYLNKLKGPKFYESGLCTDYNLGLIEDEDRKEVRIQEFDSNESPPDPEIKFCNYFMEAMSDKIIIILCICAVIELAIGLAYGKHKELDWIEGFTIVVAVAVVTLVGSINNYNKEVEFQKIKKETRNERNIYVKRNGEWKSESEENLLVGDIIKIESGISIPCDSLLIEGTAEMDESAMTGEIDPILKSTFDSCMEKRKEVLDKHSLSKSGARSHHEVESPIILSGTQVNSGDGSALIIAVGNNSENGKIRSTIDSNKSSSEGTPLEKKLADLADKIGLFGLGAAILTSIGMALNLGIRVAIGKVHNVTDDPKQIIDIFIIGIVVVVVAIPEGLPLAVTMTLAFSIKKMLKDNNFVRRMESCETMGSAEYVCTDKTGTLTKNEMLMTKMYNFGSSDKNLSETVNTNFKGEFNKYFNELEWNVLMTSLACNTMTTFDDQGNEKGNKSDESLTKFLAKFGVNVKEVREKYIKNVKGERPQIVFTSSRKKMSTLITDPNLPTGFRVLLKGASEIVVRSCTKILKPNGEVEEIDRKISDVIDKKITEFASETLRTFSIAYKDIREDELNSYFHEVINEKGTKIRPIENTDFTLVGIIGIKDHMKEGVTEAINDCNRAGISVIMITGDNKDTAYAIAKSCGIASSKEQTILGDEFMNKIGGVVCGNCVGKKDSQGNIIDAQKCSCPRSKEDWLVKYKQEARTKLKKEDPVKFSEIKVEGKAKTKYDEQLDKEAFNKFEELKIQPKVDRIANIQAFEAIIINLKVIARSQPMHKYALVTGLREMNHVVSVTGDGTNDAPALSKADVGFAMNIGTDIAKEASDIVIKDNQFSTIVKAIKWGRNIFDNIRKFLQFQLTVNVCACILVMIGASVGQESPLTAIQMLWVNMIMDSLGSLALANEKPYDELLDRPPNKKTDFIINRKMFKHILGQSIYQLIILFIILFSAEKWLLEYDTHWQNIAYSLKLCYKDAPIYFKDEFKKENMYVLSGLRTFFYDTYARSEDIPECVVKDHPLWGDADNLQTAYINIMDKNFGTPHYTIIFNTFVLMQLFNELCCRVIDDSFNFFARINTNYLFILLWFIELIFQILIIIFTGPVFNVAKFPGISGQHWGICIAFAAITFPVNVILKLIPDPCVKEKGEISEKPIDERSGVVESLRKSKSMSKNLSKKM